VEYTGINHPRKGGRCDVEQSKNQVPLYPSHYGPYPINPNLIRRSQPQIPKARHGVSPCVPILPLSQTLEFGYWKLLSPALFGTAGALFLSLFSDEKNDLIEGFGGTLFKFAIVGYSIGATVAASFAITNVLKNSRPPYDHLFLPIGGALVSTILFFAADYFLLYRFFPSSFKGDVGDDFLTQLFSFCYFSITTMATGDLGDILPANVTARALISIEIGFYLFTMATAIQLLLVQKT